MRERKDREGSGGRSGGTGTAPRYAPEPPGEEPGDLLLSVVMPVYNEAPTVERIVRRVRAVPLELEIVAVDDGSSDGSGEILSRLRDEGIVDHLVRHEQNRGKGTAVQAGFDAATGDALVIQDGDLEYDPSELPALLEPIREGRADVVYGSRFMGGRPHRVLYFWHYVGNRLLTLLSNMTTNLNLTDMETCYKCLRREVAEAIRIEEDAFGIEPEITAKVALGGWRVYEVGISYSGRTYAEGKKITWRDGVRALWCIVKYGLIRRVTG